MKAAKFALAAAAVLVIAGAARAEDRFEKTCSRTIPYHGGRVTVENSFGSLNVRTGSANSVTVRATIRSSDAEIGRGINIDIGVTEKGGITVRTVVPSISHHGSLSFSIDEEVVIPDEAPLLASNRFGSIDAIGLRASSELVNRQGSISLRDSGGTQRLENSFGSITVEHASGNIEAKNTNGSIRATNIDGRFAAINRFGSVNVNGVKGDLAVQNANGSVDAFDVGGNAAIVNGFGSTRFGRIARNLAVTSSNGRIEGSGVGGTATVHGSLDAIERKDVGG